MSLVCTVSEIFDVEKWRKMLFEVIENSTVRQPYRLQATACDYAVVSLSTAYSRII